MTLGHSTNDGVSSSDDPPYQIDGARVVGGEYSVKLAILTEYKFPVIAGHHDSDAVDVARELALHSDRPGTGPAEIDVIHSDVDQQREIFEDDVEAGQLQYVDEPSAPGTETFWDDSRHFDDQYVASSPERDADE